MGEFPWEHAMALGVGVLRLSPKDFWSMTPRELERAMSVHFGRAPAAPKRSEFAALMAAYPDK
ncbi:phage tail assembly chaperone [Pseudaminobacter sp. 19-2017]|uniref:Phage tail assembly chaperone n=1 Tax=Pseudaminobacter soli (ex Zhang et al. 2022) TaxID=2831468 RepID=A0A942IAR8_9HYPH|nr:phage tail assembly chaperone [Pseudaminobacter soli]